MVRFVKKSSDPPHHRRVRVVILDGLDKPHAIADVLPVVAHLAYLFAIVLAEVNDFVCVYWMNQEWLDVFWRFDVEECEVNTGLWTPCRGTLHLGWSGAWYEFFFFWLLLSAAL